MELREKLISLTCNNTVAELSEMLNHSHVSISWRGQRLVSVDGYEGDVTINEVASKYLKASPFNQDAPLQDKLDCDSLWGRIQQLYIESDSTSSIYKYLAALIEFRPYSRSSAGDPQAIIREWGVGSIIRNEISNSTPDEI